MKNELTDEQYSELTGQAECHQHFHAVDHTHVQVDQAQAVMVITNVSADYAAKSRDDIIVVDTTAADVTVTLPLSKNQKEFTVIKKVAANSQITAFSGVETCLGSSTITATGALSVKKFKAFYGATATQNGYLPNN